MARRWSSAARTWKAVAISATVALVAIMLFATPGGATFAKKYNLNFSPSSVQVGTSSQLTATLTNKSLYKIGSTTLGAPNGLTITAASASAGTTTVAADGKSVSVTGFSVSLGKTLAVSMTVSVDCAATGGTWTAATKSTTGSTFSLNNPGSAQNTSAAGTCINQISFVSMFGPSNTTAGGVMDEVQVRVTNASNVPIANDVVTLTGDIQSVGNTASTNAAGIATFTSIKVSHTPKTNASLTAQEDAGGQSTSGSFQITAATIEFVQQPTTTKFGMSITPAVSVKVSDGVGGAGIEGATVTMSIGTNPASGVLGGDVEISTGANGVATFPGLSIGPDDSVTSSGYQLLASIDGDDILSDEFAIANAVAGACNPCTATYPNGSTLTAPAGTTLIVENDDPDFCSSITTVIAGTVTVIPSGSADVLLTWVDPAGSAPSTEPFPQPGVTYPVCKSDDNSAVETTLDYGVPAHRCDVKAVPCIEDQYFQIGSLDLVTKVKISPVDPSFKR